MHCPICGAELPQNILSVLQEELCLSCEILKKINTLEDKIMNLQEKLNDCYMGMLRAVATMATIKDGYTAGHSKRVEKLAMKIGKAMKLSESSLNVLSKACLFHDIGKMGIDEKLLTKRGYLEPEEMEIIKMHPERAYDIISDVSCQKELAEAILYHHEKWDGSGYPKGISRDMIPLLSRIIAVADSYDAMSVPRPYRGAFDKERIMRELKANAGTQFDPQIIELILSGKVEI